MFKNFMTMSQLQQWRKECLHPESINLRSTGISLRRWFESPQAEQELNLSIPHFMVNTNHSSVVINISSSSCILRGGNSAVGFLGFQGVGVFFCLFALILFICFKFSS